MRENVMKFREKTFSMEWREKVLPLIQSKGKTLKETEVPLLQKPKSD